MIQPTRGIFSSPEGAAQDPSQALADDIAKLQADLKNNPQNRVQDEALLEIDQQENTLVQEENSIFMSNGNPNQFNQDELQRLELEKKREDITGSPLTLTPSQLNNGLLNAMIGVIRETDPTFACGQGWSEADAAVASLQQIINAV